MPARARLFRMPRPGLFALQLATVGAAGVLLGAVAFGALRLVSADAARASRASEAALLTAAIDHSTDYVDVLLQAERGQAAAAFFTPAVIVRIYEQIRLQQDSARRLVELGPSPPILRLRELAEAEEMAFRRFSVNGDAADFAAIRDIHVELHELAERLTEQLSEQAQADSRHSAQLASAASITVLVAVAAVLALLTLTTTLISRRLRSMFLRSEQERQSLERTTASIERRNAQFRALYQVAAESTDELDAVRVAESVASSALRLLDAELGVVWLAQDQGLTLAAMDATAAWVGHDGLPTDPLIPRRVAGRGRSLLMGPGAESDIADAGVEGAASGVMAPIIASSCIVGVVGCWSALPDAFDDDDRRMLEMLAAQVASAISAAGSLEASDTRVNTDALTGVPNRRQLTRDLTTRFAALDGRSLAVAMLDLDHFKRFNDTYGHAAGDVALQVVSRALVANSRNRDMVYRFGGEEFALIMEGATMDEALAALDRTLADVQRASREDPRMPAELTLSAGLACAPEHGRDLSLLLERADQALYAAKATGRARACVWAAGAQAQAA